MDEKFWSLWAEVILGAEDDDSGNDDGTDGTEDEGESSDDGQDSSEGSSEDTNQSTDDIAKLQKALAAERRIVRKQDREINRLKAAKATEESQEQESLETLQNREREAIARADRLASGLLQRDINAAIERAARAMNFLDPDDAIAGVDRTKIVYDQDTEDPTDIDIDQDTVKAAVKALAAKKPHYLSQGTNDGEPTGSPFGGKKRKAKDEDTSLRELYPSL